MSFKHQLVLCQSVIISKHESVVVHSYILVCWYVHGNNCYYIFTLSVALEATLVTNASVACPDDVVTFTCTVTGTSLMWIIDAPPDSGLSQVTSNVRSNIPINEAQLVGIIQEFKFEIVRTAADEGKLRSTLTTVSNISSYNGSVVTCVGQEQGPLTIQLAGIKF